MKGKSWLATAIVGLLVVFLPAAGATHFGLITLPDNVKVGITAVIVWGVSWLFVQLITLVPFLAFLDQFKEPLALAISAQLIAWIEQIVPDAYGNVAVTGIVFLLAILALFGVGQKLIQMNAPGFRARGEG